MVNMLEFICPICLEKVLTLFKHHTSYFPEKTIKICPACHSKLHKKLKADIKLRKDAGQFYKKIIKKREVNNKIMAALFNFLFDDSIYAYLINDVTQIWSCPICKTITHDKLFLRQHAWTVHNIYVSNNKNDTYKHIKTFILDNYKNN